MPKILIAGCGYVGNALAVRLLADNHAVWGLRRNPAALAAGVQPWRADLGDFDSLRVLPADFDAVVYAASADGFRESAYRGAYVTGVRNLTQALRAGPNPPRRFIFVSSSGVYEQNAGEWLDEDSAAVPSRFSGRRLLEGEAAAAEGPWKTVVVRFAGIYGPSRTRLIDSVRGGEARRVEGQTTILNHIHRDDCAGVLRHLLVLPAPEALYLGVDSESADRNAVLCWLAARMGLPDPPAIPASEAPTHARGGHRYYRNTRLLDSGYQFSYPTYREGYGALLE